MGAVRGHPSEGGGASIIDGGDTASMASGHTAMTQGTNRTRASQPDHIRMPQEYEKAIEFLKKREEKAAMVLAINELGDVHAHFSSWALATVSWNEALDSLIGPYQTLKNWRKALDPLSREQILQKYGLHGLLLSGVLLGKLARYSYYDNLGLRLEAARMASTLLSSVFCCTLAHPQRNVDFASYVPTYLWDGAEDIFSDPYRCNLTDLLSSLETLTSILIDNDLDLEALPMLSLWEYVAYRVARSLPMTIRSRLRRSQALSNLGLVGPASSTIMGLIAGNNLPDAARSDADLVIGGGGSSSALSGGAGGKDAKAAPKGAAPPPPATSAAASPAPFSGKFLPGDSAQPGSGPGGALSIIAEASLPPVLLELYGTFYSSSPDTTRSSLPSASHRYLLTQVFGLLPTSTWLVPTS